MQKNRIGNQKTWNRLGIWAATGMIFLLFAAMVPVVSAVELKTYTAYNQYGYGWINIGGTDHVAIWYTIPHSTVQFPLKVDSAHPCGNPCYRPYVGGVDYLVAANLPDHKNPQEWDYYSRSQIDANWDQLVLLVPRTYRYAEIAKLNIGWAYDIYLNVYWR